MDERRLDVAIVAAEAAAVGARDERASLRWASQPGDEDRESRIASALEALTDSMAPLREALGRLPWEPIPDRLERRLREASKRVQYERRQLKKMRRR